MDEKSNYYPMDGLVHEPILSLSVSGLVFGSRRFLKKVASRDSDKSLVGSVEETEQARTYHITYHISHVTHHISHITYHTSHITYHITEQARTPREILPDENKASSPSSVSLWLP